MEEEIKIVNCISNFSELFLAIYASNNVNDDNMIYFSTNIKEIFLKLFTKIEYKNYFKSINLIKINENDEIVDMNLDKFLKHLQSSKTKKYFAEEFKYDVQKNALKAVADLNIADSTIKSYDEESIKTVTSIVESYENIQLMEYYSKEEEKEEKRKYIKLTLNSKAMTECGNSTSN